MNKSCIEQNVSKSVECDFSCLIEREEALSKVQGFFHALDEDRRGILRVVGNHGTGRTRFLNEVAQRAFDYRFDVGFINAGGKTGTEDLDSRYFIIDAEKVDLLDFEKDMAKRLGENERTGLVMIVDNALNINNKVLGFIRQALDTLPLRLGVAYSIEPERVFGLDYTEIKRYVTVCTNPLSPEGVRLWIRSMLDWEDIPKTFLKWLYGETRGLPKLLQENISCLLQNGFLIYDASAGWMVSGNYSELEMVDREEVKEEKVNYDQIKLATGDFESELRLTNTMGHFLDTWEYWSEGLTRLKKILEKHETEPKLENVRLYLWYGRLANAKGDHEQVIALLKDGLELFVKAQDREGEAEVLYMTALALSIHGNLAKVSELLQKSLLIYRVNDNKEGIICVLLYLTMVYYYQGEYERAEFSSIEGLEICRELKNRKGASKFLLRLGMVARGNGEFGKAMKMFHEYLKTCEELGDKEGISNALINIAEMSRSQQNYSFARDYYERCLKLVREIGYNSLIARTLKDLGEIARYEGDFDKANRFFQESLSVLEKSKDSGETMWLYRNMAEIEMQKQCYSTAKELYLKGLRVYRSSRQVSLTYALLVFEGLAEIAFAQEELTRAARLIGAADKLFEVAGKLISKNDFAQFHTRHWKIKEKMNREAYETAWSEGNIMSYEMAIDYALTTEDKNQKLDGDMAEKMINYVKGNYNNDISLIDISEYFNMSPCYLSTMFKYYTGENFKDYLNNYRVKKAKEYLKKGKTKVGVVAKLLGCNNVNTFIRIFKKYEGMSPKQYIESFINSGA